MVNDYSNCGKIRSGSLRPATNTLVDEFARELRLQEWYHWVTDAEHAMADPNRPEGSTNPELLRDKHSAAVWYLLGALQHFDGLPIEKIREITYEIAVLGMNGLDYASAEEKYSVRSLSDEKKYSGLHLMCYMHIGFKIVHPGVDSGMDLDEPYQLALKLFQPKQPPGRRALRHTAWLLR